MLLEIRDLQVHYGAVAAVKGISVSVAEGEIVTLLGSNGAGKSSVLRCISGLKAPSHGEIRFAGARLDGVPPQRIVAMGIAQVPEGRHIWPSMTTWDNLRMGAYLRKDRARIEEDFDMVCSHFPILKEKAKQPAGSLSGGQQQMLAIGRALMSRPKLLLLDEPSLGLSPILVREIARVIADINEKDKVSIVLVEQNARLALKLARKGYVLVTGSIALEGTGAQLLASEFVKKAYLGEE